MIVEIKMICEENDEILLSKMPNPLVLAIGLGFLDFWVKHIIFSWLWSKCVFSSPELVKVREKEEED